MNKKTKTIGLCFLIDYTVTEVPVAFCPSTDCRLFQTTFLQQFRGLIFAERNET